MENWTVPTDGAGTVVSDAATVAVKFTAWPYTDGLAVEESEMVVERATEKTAGPPSPDIWR
jgi:hypothetical protein